MEKSRQKIFDEVDFTFNGTVYQYSPYYAWFDGVFMYEKKANGAINLFFKICNKKKPNIIGKPGNLKKHVEIHPQSKSWVKAFSEKRNLTKISSKLDQNTLNIVKFFLNSNVAILSLKDKYLRRILPIKLGKYAFNKVILHEVIEYMYSQLSEKLLKTTFVHLITDIWTGMTISDYLAVGAKLVNEELKRQSL